MSDQDQLRLPEVMPLDVAASLVGLSSRTLERARDNGELRASQLAKRGGWVVTRAAVLEWIASREPEPRPINPVSGPSRGSVRAALNAQRGGRRRGPLQITDEMGRAA